MSDSQSKMGDQYQLQPESAGSGSEGASTAPAPMSAGSMLRELVETVVLALILFLLIRQVVQNYRIESHSMEPTFIEGQFVLVNKLAYRLGEPQRGEVTVFHNPDNPDEDYIKRIIGLPGDQVEVVGDRVLINGQELSQPFDHELMPPDAYYGPYVVPDNSLFVMGDNRPRSSDSRAIGPISEDLVVGKAWLRVWPLSKFGLVDHYDLEPGAVQQPYSRTEGSERKAHAS
jgi:signal peptidase I